MIVTDSIVHIDKSGFLRALEAARRAEEGNGAKSIGTMGEKTLHAVLKWYYEPDGSRHEIAVGNHIADIVGESGVIEIQTRGLSRLKPKLTELLALCRVTVVHPVLVSKRLISVDASTGEIISDRLSPKHGSLYSDMREMYALREWLLHPRFTLKLPLLAADEIRQFGVKTNRRKKQRTRRGEYVSDIVPTEILDEITLAEPEDYRILLPEGLPESFTAEDFAQAASTDTVNARMAINLLVHVGLVEQAGTQGRRKIFRRRET